MSSLGLSVLERDWLSSNQVVFKACGEVSAAVVDSGYVRHAPMTLALLEHTLEGAVPGRLLNTHLHSDHCGGNHLLQAHYPGLQTWVPVGHWSAALQWDRSRLSYDAVGQACDRFAVHGALKPGDELELGEALWQVHAAPGHDMDAVMLFEPQTRTLIAGDALWEERLAIIFPELEGGPGFAATRATLDHIEHLAPRCVIPGHGAVFEDAATALARSRERLAAFERQPDWHTQHAARALLMFHLMEVQALPVPALKRWLMDTPLYRVMAKLSGHHDNQAMSQWGQALIGGLLAAGHVQQVGDQLTIAKP
ncbi:MAG: MBL fold metallo-hydrolase [Ideonella sp. MAG2]|nr:MAG: MBL fold metallo-hydrolase [Ideonella sp. MAG2]